MEPNRRFAILTFPQFFDGSVLNVNIVFLPRNQNPVTAAITAAAPMPDAPAFADAKLSFVAKIITGLSGLPGTVPSLPPVALSTAQPAQARPIFQALADQFQISNLGVQNTNLNINAFPGKAPDPVDQDHSVKKYLPLSYRQSFNFVAPRTRNALIDDTYHCAVRGAGPSPGFTQSPEAISWGQVFAHIMRQPLLAESVGMIYHAQLAIDASYFPKGGWLYIDLADSSDYRAQQKVDDTFIRKYAARIPALTIGVERSVFAAVLFPVLPVPAPGNYDQLFIEAGEYDDGFAKIVHGFQPVSDNLLLEESDGFHPTKEIGIRLGWDDEQILIWYMRQLMEDPSVGPNQRIDAPIGASGYRIDVREQPVPPAPADPWQSLNEVSSKAPLVVADPVTNNVVTLGDFTDKEINYQVYPIQLDGDTTKNYWLPMYFANWNGKSMVLPDGDAAAIYQNQDVKPDPSTNVKGGPANNLNKLYTAAPITTPLQYGNIYQFRVRMGDMSGGGPASDKDPAYQSVSQIATVHFKRFVAPTTIQIDNLPVNTDQQYYSGGSLAIKRPLLGYPAVVFTGKYVDPVSLLKQASIDMAGKEAFGIPDPDVGSVEITVELQTLKMDNLMSVSGKEAYIKFYTTTRKFPNLSPTFDDQLIISLDYRDCHVLNFGDPTDLGDLGVTQAQIDAMDGLPLPTARTIRLTIRALCDERAGYYGLEEPDPDFNTRYGRTIEFQLYKESTDERALFLNTGAAAQTQGIYLQPDPPAVFNGNLASILFGNEVAKPPDMIQRLAQQLGVENNGLTLVGKKGTRVQFGCSQRVRHTLSPDNSSITFASKGDLANHWLSCITLELDRDWTWDALEDYSLVIQRKKRFRDDPVSDTEILEVGAVEIKRTASLNALQAADRSSTFIIFIDAVEPKSTLMQPAPHGHDPRFPDLIELEYTIQVQFKQNHGSENDGDLVLPLELPITLPPSQVPKIVSAGIALSPYTRNRKYSTTQPRRRFLWIEFDSPVNDPKDTYFARVLAYAPDQLLSNNDPSLLVVPDEPALPVDPEYIRVITPGQSNDDAGLDAMQPMEKATDSDTYYLLPLPPGLNAESPEMFGFFTYEVRVGHYQYADTSGGHTDGESVWTTAQGRFGRPLRATGIQHPAPTLTCTVNRDEEKVYVTAPYAVAVQNGKSVTADPPRTQLWALLYAQVKQADNKDFRNILLDDKLLHANLRVEYQANVNWNFTHSDVQLAELKRVVIQGWKTETDIGRLAHLYKLASPAGINVDATKYGTAIWTNIDVSDLLALYGLPADSSLSVLVVEILPHITNIYEHVSGLDRQDIRNNLRSTVSNVEFPSDAMLQEGFAARTLAAQSVSFYEDRPLSDQLGQYRILRTSPLAEVPFVCVT
ncbi:MAG TPA: hypothetical protein VMT71_11095 [Syntrophorhabdales bacterium]|nr:hypothetical protein [Syntrophorhabdales bacterium]